MMKSMTPLFVALIILFAPAGAKSATMSVCKSGCTFLTIQSAINSASSGDMIEITDSGLYNENIDFSGKSLTLRGTANQRAVIQGSGAWQSGPVVNLTGAPSSRLERLRILGPTYYSYSPVLILGSDSVTIMDCEVASGTTGSAVGGINCYQSDDLKIENSDVHDNIGVGIGTNQCARLDLKNVNIRDNATGLSVDSESSVTIIGGTISGHSASGIANAGTLKIAGSKINNNTSTFYGGGLYLAGTSSTTIEDSTISGNTAGSRGGGIMAYNASTTVTVRRSKIVGNKASEGGGIYVSGYGTLEDSIVAGNNSNYWGSGVYSSAASRTILKHTTVAANLSNYNYPAVFRSTVYNSIVWGNCPTNVAQSTVSYSDVEGGYSGTGNISNNPLFINELSCSAAPSADGDYHVNGNSPAADLGDAPNATVTDIDGQTRNIFPDMGADEVSFCE